MLIHSPQRLRAPSVILAAACMASAGLVHAAAAGAHNDDYTLATLFAITAVVQLGWAALVLQRPTRPVFALGALLGFGAVTFWAVTKVWGIGFIDGLAGNQPAELQDVVATVLEAAAGFAALRALWHPVIDDRRTLLVSRFAVVLGALALVAAVPASAAPHGHEHTAGGDHAHGGHGDHANADGSMTIAGYTFEHADITAEQHEAAETLVEETRAAVAATPYADYDAAVADGYVSIRDQITGHEHLVHHEYFANDTILDPSEIESLVYEVQDDDSRVLVSAMYLMPPGTTLDDAPDIAGDVTKWHDHQNLCWDEETGSRIAGILVNGKCTNGVFRPTPAMLHVWLVDHPCGPFAGIEGGGHGEGCDHSSH